MTNLLVHGMNTAWTSSDSALLQISEVVQPIFGEAIASNKLVASSAVNQFAEFVLVSPINLSSFEELRFWTFASQAADGSIAKPFYLEFSYVDANDAPGEEHRWLVPINQVDVWDQTRIGIQSDRRSAITRLRFRVLTDFAFSLQIAQLLAVREEMLVDVEDALIQRLNQRVELTGLTNLPLSQPASPGSLQIVVPLTPQLWVGNQIRIRGSSTGDEIHLVTQVQNDTGAGTTTLQFGNGDGVIGSLVVGTATVSVIVPVILENPPTALPSVNPAIILTPQDAREDLERTGCATQRDSFRQRGNLTICSVRSPARAYTVDYQITAVAPEPDQQRLIHTYLLQQLSMDRGLPINGLFSPVSLLPQPAPLDDRRLGLLAPLYVRIGTRLETAVRQEVPWIQRTNIEAARIDAPVDQEEIVLRF
ncbi:hypothetical protein ACKFKG_30085 [Phormidesmis sp. 146-35]